MTLATTASKIFVRWNRNFDGGYQQEFFIQLLTKDLVQWKKYGPLKDTMQRQQSFTLTSMKPGNIFYVRMFSSNKIGSSNVTEVFKVTTMGKTLILVCIPCSIFPYSLFSHMCFLAINLYNRMPNAMSTDCKIKTMKIIQKHHVKNQKETFMIL